MRSQLRPTAATATKFALLPTALVAVSGVAHAQSGGNIDANNANPPVVMLLVDSSGSMERKAACECTTAGCSECLPTCDAGTATYEQNRWAMLVSALTGSYTGGFSCTEQARPTSGAPDANYHIPHFALPATGQITDGILDSYGPRVEFGLMTFDNVGTAVGQPPLMTAVAYSALGAAVDGIAGDFSYATAMQFDLPGCSTPFAINNGCRSSTAVGYGRLVTPLGGSAVTSVTTAGYIDAELRSMRPHGPSPIAPMLTDLAYFMQNQPNVQPYDAGTATGDSEYECRKRVAILITDGYPNADMRGAPYFCENAAGGGTCPYEEAETLVTQLVDAGTGTLDEIYVVGFDVANDPGTVAWLNQLAEKGNTTEARFASDEAELRLQLQSILDGLAPGTTSRAVPAIVTTGVSSSTPLRAQFNAGYVVPTGTDANGPWQGVLERVRTSCNSQGVPELQPVNDSDRFHELLDAQAAGSGSAPQLTCPDGSTSTRCVMTVVPTCSAYANRFLLGSAVADGFAPMVSGGGITEPKGGGPNGGSANGGGSCCDPPCQGNNAVGGNGSNPSSAVGGGDQAASVAGGGEKAPPVGGGPGGGNCNIANNQSPYDPLESDLDMVRFEASSFSPGTDTIMDYLSTASDAVAEDVVDWVAAVGNARNGKSALGDIYHSSPVVVGPPQFNLPDESFNLFRASVADRPTVLYVGSNDGMLHCFLAEDDGNLKAGTELWAFVPPAIFGSLEAATTGHVWTVDGTPHVKDVFYRRFPGQEPDGSIYHTMLVMPLGRGGGAYFALDVTDPYAPKFLWQFADPDTMVSTLATPALAQVLVNVSGHLEERLVTMLPAGDDVPAVTDNCGLTNDGDEWSRPLGCPAQGIGTPPLNSGTLNAVAQHRCYGTEGRHVYFIDPATGEVVSHLNDEVFNAPMTGGIGLYAGDVGTITTRAFMNDADGVMWRFNLSPLLTTDYDAVQFADMYVDMQGTTGGTAYASVGEPAYYPPVMSTSPEGNLVVIQGTGDPDRLNDVAARNRVGSFTETMEFSDTGVMSNLDATTNWVLDLNPVGSSTMGLVTGPVQLYNGTVYFSTYTAPTTAGSCGIGHSRVYGLDYLETSNSGATLPPPVPDLYMGDGQPKATYVQVAQNTLIMGVAITQDLTCVQLDGTPDNVYDPFTGTRDNQAMQSTGGGGFSLTALTSGGSGSSSGSQVGSVVRSLPPPDAYTTVNGFAGRAD